MILGLTNNVLVIILLEVILLVDSVVLAMNSTRKLTKIINIAFAVLWAVCIIMNIVQSFL